MEDTSTEVGNRFVSFKEIIQSDSWDEVTLPDSQTIDYKATSEDALIYILKIDDSVEAIKFRKGVYIGIGHTMLFYKRKDVILRNQYDKEWWNEQYGIKSKD